MGKRLLIAATAVATVSIAQVGCDNPKTGDAVGVPPTEAPRSTIVDGTRGGNSYFRFVTPGALPLLPAKNDNALYPDMEICEVENGSCAQVVWRFTRSGNPPFERRINTGAVFYSEWQTRLVNLDAAKSYRARVLLDNFELGYADIDVVSSVAELAGVDAANFIGVVKGETAKLAFWISSGVFHRVSAAGATITSADGKLRLVIPRNAVFEAHIGVIETGSSSPVLTNAVGGDVGVNSNNNDPEVDVAAIGGTQYQLLPDGFRFEQPVQVTIEFDQAAVPIPVPEAALTLRRFEVDQWVNVPGSVVDPLNNTMTAQFNVLGATDVAVNRDFGELYVSSAGGYAGHGTNVYVFSLGEHRAPNPVRVLMLSQSDGKQYEGALISRGHEVKSVELDPGLNLIGDHVTFSQVWIVGVQPASGETAWSAPVEVKIPPNVRLTWEGSIIDSWTGGPVSMNGLTLRATSDLGPMRFVDFEVTSRNLSVDGSPVTSFLARTDMEALKGWRSSNDKPHVVLDGLATEPAEVCAGIRFSQDLASCLELNGGGVLLADPVPAVVTAGIPVDFKFRIVTPSGNLLNRGDMVRLEWLQSWFGGDLQMGHVSLNQGVGTFTHTFTTPGTNNRVEFNTPLFGRITTNAFDIVPPALQPPAAPTGLSVVNQSPNAVTLRWTNHSTNAQGITVFRRTLPELTFAPIATLSAGETTFTDPSVIQGQTVLYQVAAFNSAGSTLSNGTSTVVPTGQSAPLAAFNTKTTQTGPAGQPAVFTPRVRLTDPAGQPVANAVVTFLVSQANGTLAPFTAITSSSGVASLPSPWILLLGNNTVFASVGANVVAFSALGQ